MIVENNTTPNPENSSGDTLNKKKLDLKLTFDYNLKEISNFKHRSGWKNVIKELYKINNLESQNEILMFDIIEKSFAWDQQSKSGNIKHIYFNNKKYNIPFESLKRSDDGLHAAIVGQNDIIKWNNNNKKWEKYDININEYNKLKSVISLNDKKNSPWIGIWHNPHNMPLWFDYCNSPQMIMKKDIYIKNINTCKGIIVLSNYLASWMRKNIPSHVPISILYHPTDNCDIKFSFDKFIMNERKCIIQIGYWLRNMCAIGKLKTNTYKKIWLYGTQHAMDCIDRENKIHKTKKIKCASMTDVSLMRVNDDEYDKMLSENIVFLYLYDSSANNAIIECIARNTPILINKHPAIVEYLGEDYPFYYSCIDDAEKKMHDFNLIKITYEFMKNNTQSHSKISYERFIDDFMNCTVIKNCSIKTNS